MRDLNYEIAFVQTTPTNMDSFRYRHIKQGQKVYAQLVTLDGEQQEIIQRGKISTNHCRKRIHNLTTVNREST